MKVAISTIVFVGATLTQAIAIASPEPEAANRRVGWKGFCGVPGQSCARDAAPEADAEAANRRVGWKGFCGVPGQSCARVKRSAEAIAEAFAIADPEAANRRVGWKGFCGVPGQSCAKARRSILEVGESVESAVSDIFAREAEAEAANRRVGWKGFCGVPGQSCARDADPEAEPANRRVGWKGFCGVPGQSCAKAKRDADAEPANRRVGWKGFCGVPGQSCARDAQPEESDMLAVRDASDGEGTALRAAHAAFMQVKREAEAHANETPFNLLKRCGAYDCSEESVANIAARAIGTFEERDAEACNAPGGECDLAKRQLDEIEAKLTAAVLAL